MKGFFAPKKNFQVNLVRENKKPPLRPRFSSVVKKLLLLALLIGGCVYALYFFRNTQLLTPEPEAPVNAVAQIVAEVEKQYLLPEGETPTLAIITNLEELKGQEFFVKAQVGDAVLIYIEAKKGILWRPSTHQVVEVGPVSIKTPEQVTEAANTTPTLDVSSSTPK